MAQLEPKIQRDFSGGVLSDANVSLCPPNTVNFSLNFDYDIETGSAVSRYGTSTVGAQLVSGKSILGVHQHIDTVTSANNKLFATLNASNDATSVIYDVVAGTTSVTGLTANKKMRFLTFNGATLAINGADAERSYTSAGWITTGGAFDLANIPSSNTVSLCASFLDRVYLAGDTALPTRLYYSGLSSGTTVSWTSGNGFVDIESNNNAGIITALGKVPGYLLIFKERSMHRWNFASAFPELTIQIGAASQEGVIMAGGLCAFYSNSNENAKGFYVTDGGRPRPISHDNNRPIKKWVDAIPSDTAVAGWATDRHFCWSIGDVTVDGEAYTNVVLKYNRILNQWSIRTYPQEFKTFGIYLVSGVNTVVGGGDDGTIYRMDNPSTFTDASTSSTVPIPLKLRQQHSTWSYNQEKNITDMVIVRGRNLPNLTANAIINEDLFNRVGLNAPNKRNRIINKFDVTKTIRGNSISIELDGESTGARTYIREIEIPNININESFT